MLDAAFFAAVLFGSSVYFLASKRLHPFHIAFVWVVVVCMDEIYFTLMLLNWSLFSVADRIDELAARLINLNVVTPIIALLGLEASVRSRRRLTRAAIGVATASALFAVDAFLIRSGIYRAEEGFRWIMLCAEEAFLVLCSYGGLFLMSAFMRKDGIGYDPFH